ncbi:MAG: gamma carbonic anhydrase family protein [Rhodospirillaceae bacterium]|jgi:carbonic anhydrase/acetyltransferase-like protein (isoleucine patch superfamily)|nr:gamma carbonic anhydrase family protein [Rhodospirillaceae bacterium]MBT4588402.1 gamma carbonic anhydrase family protein [Rhodospirillaceae bacterium]MBT4940768.1 gamma carbonic anhydrase family protein [Rhodospirillaceae bacterium]MBT5939831.1 gamma carbonic anhydrase family protein [Rhodospirillaceae bacterium]MBT7267593.1 gamma carbonic anhydrase family protein [Rhodospirillaceae bacterium]
MIYALGEFEPQYAGDSHWIADSADLMGNIHIGLEVNIWWNAVIRGDNELITIGNRSNVQDGCVLHTDPGYPLTIGDNVTVGHMCMLHGCEIGSGSLIGIGSTILNGAKIGKNVLIGAHSLITEGKEIPDNSLVMGSPGKVIREMDAEQIATMAVNSDGYVERSKYYARELRKLS